MQERMEEQNRNCLGRLPQYAPLANPYVPFQQCNPTTYPAKKGIVRGTLFPGLDLPFLGMVNEGEIADRPLQELQALSFAITELGMYLDTHPNDTASLTLFRQYVELYEDGKRRYEAQNGPLMQKNAGMDGEYNWLESPWPWDDYASKED